MSMVDPSFLPVSIDANAPIYLPAHYVREQAANLAKARKTSSGKIFSDYRTIATHLGPGAEKPYEGLPFGVLRQLADASPIDRIIIDTRIVQMKRVARRAMGRTSIGFAVRHVRDQDPDFDVPDGIKKIARQLEEMINTPEAPYHATARDFFTCAVEEELVLDRKAMVITRDGRGRPVKFHLLDGSTIRPVPAVIFAEIQKRAAMVDSQVLSYDQMAYMLSEQSGYDMTESAYCQIVDAKITGAWRDDEMSVDITNPTVALNWWGYGRSLLEKSWRLSDGFLKAWTFNIELFKLNYPEAVLAIKGAYDEEGLRSFKRKILGEGDGIDNNWRLPVIPMEDAENAALELVKLRDTPREMMFVEFLGAMIRLKCAAYRMHPSMVNFTQDSQGGVVFNSQANKENEIEQAQEEGYMALLDSQSDWLTRVIIREYHEDLRLVFVGLDEEGEDAKVDRAIKKLGNYATINEIRKEMGMKQMKPGIPKEPADFIGAYQQAIQIIQGAQQQEAQAGGQGYDDGDFGDGGQGQPGQAGGQQGGAQQVPGAPGDARQPGQTPQAPRPQDGGPQHLDEEAKEPLQRSRKGPRYLSLTIQDDEDSDYGTPNN
jgi:hypothetical protein